MGVSVSSSDAMMAAMAIDDVRKTYLGDPPRLRLDAISVLRSTGMTLRQAAEAVDYALLYGLSP